MTLTQRTGLYEACQQISPIHPDHATLPIQEGFNWSSCLGDARFERLYLVVFRSMLRVTADLELLSEHDERVFAEALDAGGLLCYFRGAMNERRECLSFCLWESREQARRASSGSLHRAATGIVAEMYESYSLERYEVMKVEGTKGRLVFRPIEGVSSRQDTGEPGQPS
jgi:predicted methyltransferase MtxX (methanogen marker protein 4)